MPRSCIVRAGADPKIRGTPGHVLLCHLKLTGFVCFFYAICWSSWRWNDGSVCEFNQDLWNTGVVPCGERSDYTRVRRAERIRTWKARCNIWNDHKTMCDWNSCLFTLVLVSTQSTTVDVSGELHPVHQKLCDFPSLWCDKVMDPVRDDKEMILNHIYHSVLKGLHYVLSGKRLTLSHYQSSKRENCFLQPLRLWFVSLSSCNLSQVFSRGNNNPTDPNQQLHRDLSRALSIYWSL